MSWRPSLRLLIIGSYVATVGSLLAGVGLALHEEHRGLLTEALADRQRSVLRQALDDAPPPGGQAVADLRTLPGSVAPASGAASDPQGFAWAVLDLAGEVVAGARSDQALSDPTLHAAVLETGSETSGILGGPDGAWLVRVWRVTDPGGRTLGTMSVGHPMEIIEADLAGLRAELAVTLGAASLVAVLLGFFVAGATMRPLGGMVRTARQIARGEHGRRAALPMAAEPRELADAFNTMLDRLETAHAEAAETATRTRRLAADASHELRSPVAVLANGVQVIRQALSRGEVERAAQLAETVDAEIGGLARLVDDLLALARLDEATAGAGLDLGIVEPLPLLEEEAARARLLATGQELRLRWPRGPIAAITADQEMVRRALHNLVENALSDTPAGAAVTLTVETADGGCRFVVEDEGRGIDHHDLPHVLDRFYRASDGRRPGTGLGLAIVAAIAAAHGGRVELDSTIGHGTRATLWLPVSPHAHPFPDSAAVQPALSRRT